MSQLFPLSFVFFVYFVVHSFPFDFKAGMRLPVVIPSEIG